MEMLKLYTNMKERRLVNKTRECTILTDPPPTHVKLGGISPADPSKGFGQTSRGN